MARATHVLLLQLEHEIESIVVEEIKTIIIIIAEVILSILSHRSVVLPALSRWGVPSDDSQCGRRSHRHRDARETRARCFFSEHRCLQERFRRGVVEVEVAEIVTEFARKFIASCCSSVCHHLSFRCCCCSSCTRAASGPFSGCPTCRSCCARRGSNGCRTSRCTRWRHGRARNPSRCRGRQHRRSRRGGG